MGKTKIPFLNLASSYKKLKPEINLAIKKVLEKGVYISGNEVSSFEKKYAKFCDARYCVGVSSGLDALTLTLKALNIGIGDEVIVPSHTYVATWFAVSNVGAVPVPVEVYEKNYNIDVKLISKSISKKTKAIIPVHLYGQPAEMDVILSIAKKYKLYVIEDAAQAHGAYYKGCKIGTHGDVTAWSFYPAKNLGAFGDAGAITTNNLKIANKIRLLSNYGSKKKYLHDTLGFNSRLDPIQASILSIKIKYLHKWNAHRKKLAKIYSSYFENSSLSLQEASPSSKSAWHLYVIRHKKRNLIKNFLQKRGVGTLIHYPVPPHKQKAYSNLKINKKNLLKTENISKEILSLPLNQNLNEKDIRYIAKLVLNCIDK